MKNEFVSVIIPTYNRCEKLKKSIQSVLNQTYTNFELIIVDDGSDDDTKAYVKGLEDSRVKYVRRNHGGACAARNYGMEIAAGRYVAFQDSDDCWRPEKLEMQMDIMEKYHPGVVFCKLARNLNGTETNYPTAVKEGFLREGDSILHISTQTILVDMESIGEERFRKEIPRLQDFEFLYRLSYTQKIYCLDKGLADWSMSDDSISQSPQKLRKAIELIFEWHTDIWERMPEVGMYFLKNLRWEGFRLKNKGADRAEYQVFFDMANSYKKKESFPKYAFGKFMETGLFMFLYNLKHR